VAKKKHQKSSEGERSDEKKKKKPEKNWGGKTWVVKKKFTPEGSWFNDGGVMLTERTEQKKPIELGHARPRG